MGCEVFQGDDVSVRWPPAVSARSVVNGRRNQQDAFVVSDHLVAVADGLGGHVRGDEASRAALEALCAAVSGPCTIDELLAGVDAAQSAVAALADGDLRNAATTLVAAAVADDGSSLHGVWSGDSRVWAFTDATPATLLTADHTYAGGGISACLGDDTDAFRADTFTVDAGHGFVLVLTSDGVHGRLGGTDAALRAGLISQLAAAGVDVLVEHAVTGDTDNATAVVVDVDTWVERAPTSRPPRRWVARRRRWRGRWSVWIPGLTAPAEGATRAEADAELAAALVRWPAKGRPATEFTDLAEAVVAANGDLAAVQALFD